MLEKARRGGQTTCPWCLCTYSFGNSGLHGQGLQGKMIWYRLEGCPVSRVKPEAPGVTSGGFSDQSEAPAWGISLRWSRIRYAICFKIRKMGSISPWCRNLALIVDGYCGFIGMFSLSFLLFWQGTMLGPEWLGSVPLWNWCRGHCGKWWHLRGHGASSLSTQPLHTCML